MRTEHASFEAAAEPDRAADMARQTFVVCIAVALLVVLGAWFAAGRRRQKRSEKRASARSPSEPPASLAAHTRKSGNAREDTLLSVRKAGILACPVCDREFRNDRVLKYCPTDGSRLAARSPSSRPRECLVCPICERGYADADVCEVDGEQLLPKALATAHRMGREPKGASRGQSPNEPRNEPKVCPTCGVQFKGPYAYCSRDGAALTLLQ